MTTHGVLAAALPHLSHRIADAISKYAQPLLGKIESSPGAMDRIREFYIPVFAYLDNQLPPATTAAAAPMIIGLSAPQGCGKTTLTDSLCEAFELSGRRCVSLSLDDFYLTGEEQDSLAASKPDNELLQCRGNAGTHDMKLLKDTLTKLQTAEAEEVVSVPRYDKSMRAGRGDRAPSEAWTKITGRPDVVLLEGWMLGFTPLQGPGGMGDPPAEEAQDIFQKYSSLVDIDAKLREYTAVHHLVDSWVVLAVEDPRWVFEWRLQAEVAMRESGRPGMTDEQVVDFVSCYMPGYKAYLPQLYRDGPDRASSSVSVLKITVDSSRTPVGADIS